MVIAMDGPQCACGSRGCLEALASGSAIGRMGREAAAQEAGARILRHTGGEKNAVTGAHVAMAAAEGDPKAQAILSSATRALGIGVANVMNALGPELIVLGGGVVAKNGDRFVSSVAETARAGALPGCSVPVVRAALGERSGALGALALARDEMKSGH